MYNQFLNQVYLGNSFKDYLMALLIILGTLLLAKLSWVLLKTMFGKITSHTETVLDDVVVSAMERPIIFLIGFFGLKGALSVLSFSESISKYKDGILFVSPVMIITWLVARVSIKAINFFLIPFTAKTKTTLDNIVLPIITKTISLLIWVIGFGIIFDYFGYDTTKFFAGLGIGGLALAMASKDFVANLFGGVTILVDQPFDLKDKIKIAGFQGTVVEIGLRCTRLKADDGQIITVPNSKFSSSPIENFGKQKKK